MMQEFHIWEHGNRKICLKGIGKLFYETGFPIVMSVEVLREKGIEISFLHLVEELWENGWSWKTIHSKFLGEIEEDINHTLQIDFSFLQEFYMNIDQPLRKNGGYEKSREIIFEYLFNTTYKDARNGKNTEPLKWARTLNLEL